MPNWFIALPVAGAGWFERVPATPAGVRRFIDSDLHMTVAFPPTDASPLSGAPVSSLLPVPGTAQGAEWAFEIPIRTGG
jgi:hypothetical protein